MKAFRVQLEIFRGADPHPVRHTRMSVIMPSAIDAACRAEELVNVTVADNEYAAAVSVTPVKQKSINAAEPALAA